MVRQWRKFGKQRYKWGNAGPKKAMQRQAKRLRHWGDLARVTPGPGKSWSLWIGKGKGPTTPLAQRLRETGQLPPRLEVGRPAGQLSSKKKRRR